MSVDREPGGSTMIRISIETKDRLTTLKEHDRVAIGDVVRRILKENQAYHKYYPTIQTKEKMEREIKDFVLNPSIPDTNNRHRDIWLAAHPEETLTQNDVIHHINGNHDDNRVENLQKVTTEEHGKLHSILRKTA
jgi:hypothetical protein